MDPIAYYQEYTRTKKRLTKFDESAWTLVPTLIESFTRRGE